MLGLHVIRSDDGSVTTYVIPMLGQYLKKKKKKIADKPESIPIPIAVLVGLYVGLILVHRLRPNIKSRKV